MNTEEILSVLNSGGVVTIDGSAWSVDKAHAEDDMPEELRQPLNDDEAPDDWLDRQGQWWDTLEVCNPQNTKVVALIEALCKRAGVRVRGL